MKRNIMAESMVLYLDCLSVERRQEILSKVAAATEKEGDGLRWWMLSLPTLSATEIMKEAKPRPWWKFW